MSKYNLDENIEMFYDDKKDTYYLLNRKQMLYSEFKRAKRCVNILLKF